MSKCLNTLWFFFATCVLLTASHQLITHKLYVAKTCVIEELKAVNWRKLKLRLATYRGNVEGSKTLFPWAHLLIYQSVRLGSVGFLPSFSGVMWFVLPFWLRKSEEKSWFKVELDVWWDVNSSTLVFVFFNFHFYFGTGTHEKRWEKQVEKWREDRCERYTESHRRWTVKLKLRPGPWMVAMVCTYQVPSTWQKNRGQFISCRLTNVSTLNWYLCLNK